MKEKELNSLDLLFKNKSGKIYKSGCSLNKTLKFYCEKAGIEKSITNHSFRHSFITDVAERCGLLTA